MIHSETEALSKALELVNSFPHKQEPGGTRISVQKRNLVLAIAKLIEGFLDGGERLREEKVRQDVADHNTPFPPPSKDPAPLICVLTIIASGVLPNGDHVEGATLEYASTALKLWGENKGV